MSVRRHSTAKLVHLATWGNGKLYETKVAQRDLAAGFGSAVFPRMSGSGKLRNRSYRDRDDILDRGIQGLYSGPMQAMQT